MQKAARIKNKSLHCLLPFPTARKAADSSLHTFQDPCIPCLGSEGQERESLVTLRRETQSTPTRPFLASSVPELYSLGWLLQKCYWVNPLEIAHQLKVLQVLLASNKELDAMGQNQAESVFEKLGVEGGKMAEQ